MVDFENLEEARVEGWVTLEEIQSTLMAFYLWDEEVRDLKRLRMQVGYYVRVGALPKPKRVPRTDGKRGTIGVYPSGTPFILHELLANRETKGRSRETLPKNQAEVAQPQRQYSVAVWLPEALADQIDRRIEAGFPLSRQLLIGFRLLDGADEDVQLAIIREWIGVEGEEARSRTQEVRWQYAAGLGLTGYLVDHLNDLTAQLKVTEEQLLREVRFEFAVVGGHVHVKKAFVKAQDGQWQAVEVKDV